MYMALETYEKLLNILEDAQQFKTYQENFP